MPKEYSQSDSSASSPNPSQFGSSEIRLDTPQFTAQTAVEQQQNPFDMLQGVLQSAVGAVTQSNKNKEAAIQGKLALAQAKYITQQRAYSEQARIKGDANEVISNEIVRDQTALDKLYSVGLFDLAGVQLTVFEEGATSDRKKAWAAKERLQMDAQQRAWEARLEADASGRSNAERALLAPALFQINSAALELDILSSDAIDNNKSTFYDNVRAENLQASLRDLLMKITVDPMTGERRVGLKDWDVMSDGSKQAIEAHVVQQISGSLGRVTAQRAEVRQRLATKELTATVNAVSQTVVDGDVGYLDEVWSSVNTAHDNEEISDATANKFRSGIINDIASSYNLNGGFAGTVAAAEELKRREATGEISGNELNRGLSIIDKRAKKEAERAVGVIESRGRAVTPENDQHTLASIPELASTATLKEMGITEESAMQFPDVMKALGKIDEDQARDIAAVERDVEQENRVNDTITILGIKIRDKFNIVNNIKGTEGYEAERASLEKSANDQTLSPRVRNEYASALVSLTSGVSSSKGFGLTDAQDLWQATTRRAKDFPPGSPEYNAVMATGLDSMIRMGTFYPAAVKHLENIATQGGNNLTMARDFILKSGALRGEPATADMFFDQAPNLTRAVLLTQAQEKVAGKALGEETLQANLNKIMERDAAKRSSSAFVTTAKEEGASDTAVAPLKYQAQLQAAMDGVYGISGLDMNGFTYNADDQQVFNTFFTEGLHSNLGADGVGNPAAAIVYAVNAMQMVGYSPRYNGGKVDFVYDPYQVVPVIVTTENKSSSLFGEGQDKENFNIVVKKTALAALKALYPAEFGSLDSADGVVVDLVMDSNYMGSPEGGVPFNITLPTTGRVILYTKYPAGQVPLIRRKDVENYKKTQRKMPPLSKILQEAPIIE